MENTKSINLKSGVDEIFQVNPSESDQSTLARYRVLADGISRIFGSSCEVVIHSLEDMSSSVVTIFNGHVTGRTVGSPITDLALQVLGRSLDSDEDVIGPYFSKTESGRQLKSVTVLLRNAENTPIGFLCINFDLSVPFHDLLLAFTPIGSTQSETGEHFAPDVGALVRRAIGEERESIARIEKASRSERNSRLILALEKRGIFGIKGSVEHAAHELGVTKFTIYKYLRALRS